MQRGITLYLGKIKAGDLLDIGVLTEWDPDLGWDLETQGYQRAPIRRHFLSIARFLASDADPLMPTSALLSAREQDYGILHFKAGGNNADPDFGVLTIPEGRQIFIVDYQHRWRGLQEAIKEMGAEELRNFQIPFVLMADARRYEEIKQFYLINNKQKRVDTDLALALMETLAGEADESELLNLVGTGNKYKIRAGRLTFRIAALDSGVWVDRLQEPNNPKPNAVVAPKSFVDSLRTAIGTRSPVRGRTDDELIQILSDYWSGIESILPIAFQNPQDYLIQKALGVFVMHRVATVKVFEQCQRTNDFTPGNIAAILQPARREYLSDSFWRARGPIGAFSSGSGQAELARRIVDLL